MLTSSLTGLFDRNIQISRESRIENEKSRSKNQEKKQHMGNRVWTQDRPNLYSLQTFNSRLCLFILPPSFPLITQTPHFDFACHLSSPTSDGFRYFLSIICTIIK
jgi:hypothetical protein